MKGGKKKKKGKKKKRRFTTILSLVFVTEKLFTFQNVIKVVSNDFSNVVRT